jgi:EAL domain-containing protein (putative c-di-GMP-specific phosphodiesterase class I)
LSYLKRFHVHKLKIDQSFVRGLADDPEDQAIVKAIINLAGSLGVETIAEGVEEIEQIAFLRAHGCRQAQGYYFSQPVPAEQFTVLLRESTELHTV